MPRSTEFHAPIPTGRQIPARGSPGLGRHVVISERHKAQQEYTRVRLPGAAGWLLEDDCGKELIGCGETNRHRVLQRRSETRRRRCGPCTKQRHTCWSAVSWRSGAGV